MNEKRMVKLSEFAKTCNLSYQHLHKLFKAGKLNAKQIDGPGSSIIIDSQNPFDLSPDDKPSFLDIDEIEFALNDPAAEKNLELIIHVNKLLLKEQLESKNRDDVAINRHLKQLMDASKLLLQHRLDSNEIEGEVVYG